MMESVRNKNCYICGRILKDESKPVDVFLDGRFRKVHRDCELQRQKALKDFAQHSYD
jgi:hypothetical protein